MTWFHFTSPHGRPSLPSGLPACPRAGVALGVLEPGSHYATSRKQDFYVNYSANDHYSSSSMLDERTHRMTDVYARLAPGAKLATAR